MGGRGCRAFARSALQSRICLKMSLFPGKRACFTSPLVEFHDLDNGPTLRPLNIESQNFKLLRKGVSQLQDMEVAKSLGSAT